MLNLKKSLLAATVLTALCATAFAADTNEQPKPSMRERVNCILSEDGNRPCDNQGPRDHFRKEMKRKPMTAEQREEMKKRHEEWKKMTPQQRQEAREKMQKERQERHDTRAKEAMAKLTPQQKAEVEAFIKEDAAQRQARKEKLQNMTPEQREAIRANRPLKKGPMHKGDKPRFGHNDFRCGPAPDCPAAPAK